ncbi:Aquaporin-1 [Ceratocystis pirilliformis]|uniref:Aquaporin-1 n=1 Tax=Ceratocystis pirilliformis TaxID=259994 RepID=A0ABR3Z0N6_9PEZI
MPAAPTARRSGLSDPIRNELVAAIAEFCGTFMFLFMAFCGTQNALNSSTNSPGANDTPNVPTLFYISSCFGVSLAVNVWVFYRLSGGMFNPAVSFALALIGAITPLRCVIVMVVQIVAGIAAAGMADALVDGPLRVTNTLGAGTSITRGLFLEMFLTSQLVIVVYFLAVEKHKATFLAPIGVGMSVFMAHMVGVYLTGCSINPARAFGPAVIDKFPGYHWIYWLGPFMGALLAFVVYKLLVVLEYGTANPGQDGYNWEINSLQEQWLIHNNHVQHKVGPPTSSDGAAPRPMAGNHMGMQDV